MLAKEVGARRPKTPGDWDDIAIVLSPHFSSEKNAVKLSGRACRDRLGRLMEKFVDEDKKALKRFACH